MNNLTNLTRKIIRFSFYALFFATPLILTPFNFELFEFNKMMFVYVATVIITGSWAIHSIATKKFSLRRTPLDIPLLLFFLSQVTSTFFSINRHTSLIGYYSRFHGGLYSTISYLILYYAFVTFMGNKQKTISSKPKLSSPISNSIALLLTSGALVAAYGVAEHFGIDAKLWIQDVQTRVFSTLGQPNWLAAFLITIIPLTLVFALSSQKSHLFFILFSLFFLTLLYTKSRSGILGFVAMYSIFWTLVLLKAKLKQFPKKIFLIFVLLVFALSLVDGLRWIPQVRNFYQKFEAQKTAQESPTPPPKPQIGTQLATGGTESGEIRRIVWKGALAVWRHWPVFGSGVETFAYSYYNFRPASHNLVSEWDFLYNKAHNEYLNFLATTGLVGLGSYLLLQAWFVVWTLKQIFKNKSLLPIHHFLLIALLAGYAGLAVSNFFGFSTVAVGLLFFLWPAIAVVIAQPSTIDHQRSTSVSTSLQKIFISLALLLTAYFLFLLTRWWYADTLFAKGKNYLDAGYASEAFPRLDKAVKLLPREPTFRSKLAEAASDLSVNLARQEPPVESSPDSQEASNSALQRDLALQYAQLALAHTDITQALNPVDLKFVKGRARVLLTLSQLNPELLQDARDALLRGLELSPTDAKLMYNLGLLYLQLGDDQTAQEILEKTVEIKPDYEAARFALGTLYQELGAIDKARQHYEYILNFIAPDNSKVQEKLEAISTR